MASNIGAEIWSFFKLNFKWILAAGLFLFLWFQGCFGPRQTEVIITHRDTTIVIHEGSGTSAPQIINVLPSKPTIINQPQYKPDTSSMAALRAQFEALVAKHTQRNVYNDTLKIDTLGYVNIKDTVSENKLGLRGFNYSIKERLITITNNIYPKPKNKWYAGLELGWMTDLSEYDVQIKLLLQNKREDILGIGGGLTLDGKPVASASYYRKIKIGGVKRPP